MADRMDITLEYRFTKDTWSAIKFFSMTAGAVFLPKSQIIIRDKNNRPMKEIPEGTPVKVNLPVWLAKKTGLTT